MQLMAFITNFPPATTSLSPTRTQGLNLCRARPLRLHGIIPARRRAVVNMVTHKAREVTAEELEYALQANARPMIIDAFAQWCGPCQFLIPQLDIIAKKFGDRLDILKFDTERYPNLASTLQVRGLPTLFFIRDGQLRYRMEGALTADQLEQVTEYVLFEGPPPDFAPQEKPS